MKSTAPGIVNIILYYSLQYRFNNVFCRDNKSSFSSGKRKRESQERIGRKRIGYKPDMIIQAVREGNRPLEFGACEAASFYDGPTGKKIQV
jgi:hypothetical protein